MDESCSYLLNLLVAIHFVFFRYSDILRWLYVFFHFCITSIRNWFIVSRYKILTNLMDGFDICPWKWASIIVVMGQWAVALESYARYSSSYCVGQVGWRGKSQGRTFFFHFLLANSDTIWSCRINSRPRPSNSTNSVVTIQVYNSIFIILTEQCD